MALKVVVLRALGLGDLLTGVPALRAILRTFPDEVVHLAIDERYAPLVRYVDPRLRVVHQPGLHVPLHRSLHGADLAVNLHGTGPQSTALLRAGAPAALIAFDAPAGGRSPDEAEHEHERERWCRLLRTHGIDADASDLSVHVPARPGPDRVVVHVGASAPARRWPLDRWAVVVDRLAARGAHVVLTGGADERDDASRVAGAARDPRRVTVVAGRTSCDALAMLVAGARLVVSGDTGVAHLAFATGTPSVTLYGPSAPAVWGPPARPCHVALWRGRLGDPHALAPDPGLLDIGVADVLAALERGFAPVGAG